MHLHSEAFSLYKITIFFFIPVSYYCWLVWVIYSTDATVLWWKNIGTIDTYQTATCKESVCLPHSFTLLLFHSEHFFYDLCPPSTTSSHTVTVTLMQSRYMRTTHVVLSILHFHHQICTLQSSNILMKLPKEIDLRLQSTKRFVKLIETICIKAHDFDKTTLTLFRIYMTFGCSRLSQEAGSVGSQGYPDATNWT